MKLTNKNNQILKITKQRLATSTIHAIPNIVGTKQSLVKFIWFISFILSTCLCSQFIFKSLNEYFTYDVVSKLDITYKNELTFPIVSFCHLNPFTTEYSRSLLSNISNLRSDNILIKTYLAQYYAKYKILNNNSSKKLGFDLKDVIVSCIFNYQNCNLDEDFEHYYDIQYGNCYRYNSGRLKNGTKVNFKHLTQVGTLGSFQLELFLHNSTNQNEDLFSSENGFIIFISNETIDSTVSEGINISPGYSTKIKLEKYTISKQSKPYSECTAGLLTSDSYDSINYKLTFQKSATYHYSDCLKVCFFRLIEEKCRCHHIYMGYDQNSNLRKCLFEDELFNENIINENDMICENELWFESFSHNSTIIKQCDCPFECQKSGYSYFTSFSQYPTRVHAKYLLENSELIQTQFSNHPNLSLDLLGNHLSKLVIFYDEMKESKISQEIKYHLTDLISNIGGTLSLFLGLSFLSFIEIIEIFISVMKVLCKQSSKYQNNFETFSKEYKETKV